MKRPSCQRCMRALTACLCKSLPPHPIENHWPVHILQHRQERNHALNTAHIARMGLAQCQLHTVADSAVEDNLARGVMAGLNNAWLLYPGEQSIDVAELDLAASATRPLIILDGSWRKSRRMLFASAWLQTLPRISFALACPSRYRIRKEPEAHYCSTVEAICTVLGTLEQDHEKYAPLLSCMDAMVAQQIEQMGEVTYRRNYRVDDGGEA